MTTKALMLQLILVISALTLKAQDHKPSVENPLKTDYSQTIKNLDELIRKKMMEYHILGVAIALADEKSSIWAQGFGYTDTSNTKKVDNQTLFSIQSLSKSIVTTAFLMEASKGKYHLDDPIVKYYPSFNISSRYQADDAKKITFRELLSHRAGFSQEAPLGSNYDTVLCTFEDHIKSISNSWLRLPVGKFYSYSNTGPDLTGYIISKNAGVPIRNYLTQKVLKPLNMEQSTYDQDAAYKSGNLAKGYYGHSELKKTCIADLAAGGVYSNATDMGKFLTFQLNNCTINDKAVIAPELLKEMRTVQFKVPGQQAGYGLGVILKPYLGRTLVYHPGGGYGYSAEEAFIPEAKVGVVILTNSADGYPFIQEIFHEALREMVKTKYGSLPEPDKPLACQPVIKLDSKYLKTLTGSCKTGRKLVEIACKNDGLIMISGSDTTVLNAYDKLAFSDKNANRYLFHLHQAGLPGYFINVNESDADFYIFNDAPIEKPGANKPSWKALPAATQDIITASPKR